MRFLFVIAVFLIAVFPLTAQSQDKIKIAYSSTDTLNQLWTIPQETGLYKKNGLDVDMVYIGSTTVGISAIIAQDIQIGNAAGSGVANANVRGADTVSVGCTINVLAYELVVLDSVKTAEDLKGKSIGKPGGSSCVISFLRTTWGPLSIRSVIKVRSMAKQLWRSARA